MPLPKMWTEYEITCCKDFAELPAIRETEN